MRDQLDANISAAMHEVPVPEGLAERLLIGLVNNQAEATVGAKTVSRRWALAYGGLAATAAGLMVAVWLGSRPAEHVSEQCVLDEAIRSFNLGFDEPGHLLSEKPAPAEHPLSRVVLRIRGTRWRHLEGFLGHRGLVYDLPGPAGARASLYVVAQDVEGLGTAPSLRPFTTAGRCATAWSEGGLLYVLVVQGDPTIYRGYLNLPRSPVA